MTQSTPWPVDRLAQAIGDPGSIVGRCLGPSWGVGQVGYAPDRESFPRWATRAVLAVLDEFERDRPDAAPADRGAQLQAEMVRTYFPINADDQVRPRIYEDILRRNPPGVDPPGDLVDEFPAELGEVTR